MKSLVLVITIARCNVGGGGCSCAVPWKEEGEVPAWSDGGGAQKLSDDFFPGRKNLLRL